MYMKWRLFFFKLKNKFLFHRFWAVVCSFSFVSRIFLISSLISLLTHSFFNNMLFTLHIFECVWVFPWGWFLVSSHCDLRKCLIWFQFSWVCWDCFVSYHVVRLWKCSMCIWKYCTFFILWGERFCMYQLSPFYLDCCSMAQYSCWYFVWKMYPLLTVVC